MPQLEVSCMDNLRIVELHAVRLFLLRVICEVMLSPYSIFLDMSPCDEAICCATFKAFLQVFCIMEKVLSAHCLADE